ncbi:DNA integration/recombination/invertion protein [Yersinia ruckeri ATCC 29473]|uniref:helix-turn-helix domain-containing protein n=1 Tax=Yersinia ruckeri TaxID=29486 RepID=UPI0001A57955|nr:helix-turn-helix domain-containing protein [Yersinia ruckeri]EEP97470.1 DNA integration/recombination/invertion protein [Yersinia ruckeri ATCC 29473]
MLALVAEGQSYRQIGRHLDLSKNTVLGIVKRERKKQVNEMDSTNTDGYETQ